MNWQLFPQYCGWEVAENWCPVTDIRMFILIILFTITIYILYRYILKRALKYISKLVKRKR